MMLTLYVWREGGAGSGAVRSRQCEKRMRRLRAARSMTAAARAAMFT